MDIQTTIAFEKMRGSPNRMEDHYLNQLFNIYHQRLLANEEVCRELEDFGISLCVIKEHGIGYCDRTLNHYISTSAKNDGAAFRGTLRQFGLFKETGHELFRGCIVEPVFTDGIAVAACGIKLHKPNRPSPRLLQWYRYSVYLEPVIFHIMSWGKRYVTH